MYPSFSTNNFTSLLFKSHEDISPVASPRIRLTRFMKDKCDVIVVGCGGIGSAALYSLASRGLDVVGIDKFSPPHIYGSSHGDTRAIRKAYFEHPNYVPLLQSSYTLWRNLEKRTQKNLMHLVGVLGIGPSDGILINGVRKSARTHNLPVEFLSINDASELFPGLSLTDENEIAFEQNAGYLLVEDCIESFLSLSISLGAKVLTDTCVLEWSASPGGSIQVSTSTGSIEADALVLTAGPWASSLLGTIEGPRLSLRKKHMYWYSNDNPAYFSSSGFPVFAFELSTQDDGRVYYGFPQHNSSGVKLAEHTGGEWVESPANIHKSTDPDEKRTTLFQRTYLPHISGKLVRQEACLYTVSHDENFYLDTHPEFNNVAYAAGLSGHGFKFAPVLGEILADLATEGKTAHDIDFLRTSTNRFD